MKTNIKVGDILAGTTGYSMVIPIFYKVVGITDKRLKVVELCSRMVQSTDGGYNQQGYEMPITDSPTNYKVVLAKPCERWEGEFKIGSRYDAQYVHLWD